MKKILIVDDEFLIRYSLSHMLANHAVEITAVASGREALREISTGAFDLCCLDINLPDLSGMDIMKMIKGAAPHTKIIIMTGADVTKDMLKDIENNSELLLAKPFDLFKVKAFVDRILDQGKPFFRNSAALKRDYRASEYWLMNDQRRNERRPANERIAYASPRQQHEQTAEVVDISDSGMCVLTSYRMPHGIVLNICNDKTERCYGIVRWSTITGSDNIYRTGIEFTDAG